MIIKAYLLEEMYEIGDEYSCFKDLETAKIYYKKRNFRSPYKILEVIGELIANENVIDAKVLGDTVIGPVVKVAKFKVIAYERDIY